MRIISKFDDFYDRGQAFGPDASLVFVRKFEEHARSRWQQGWQPVPTPLHLAAFDAFALAQVPADLSFSHDGSVSRVHVAFMLIWFAGRLYPLAQVCLTKRGEPVPDEPTFIYEYRELAALLDRFNFDCSARDRRAARWGLGLFASRATLQTFFQLKASEVLMNSALEHRQAIALWRHNLVQECPQLKLVQFYRCLDAWQAHQELSMFLGNLAAPDRVPVVVEDKYRILQHGFDRYSFRKPPQAD